MVNSEGSLGAVAYHHNRKVDVGGIAVHEFSDFGAAVAQKLVGGAWAVVDRHSFAAIQFIE